MPPHAGSRKGQLATTNTGVHTLVLTLLDCCVIRDAFSNMGRACKGVKI